ncbi:hypothetical protein CKN86_06825 [Carnobacterium divergens]|uniref:helix-turn-helix domain-containing protein n=1 Tax=Carnobacterium divergens TaxID=2748 RepID=UPI000D4A6D86|nr:helix-turn-helix transcriptional regulator [Carnobacterium divergens]MCO6016915.1 helix-turn-helix transcriptional regulator [Carnobacterium divergens]TFI62546.1 hypothetical protein CKN62_06860 [Carnobacterium divergens]TFI89748.1 hypothetical protein CKN84_06860 [Carnobacterium divergens]TFJ04803.1 hypothetical protein CKN86_06825 [Carnobacterium divergens]TFJ06293.1 hypothetical protein CKN65_06865 [Carnobacterium divergens]
MSKLSERLKEQRTKKKLTQQVLADKVGVNRVTYTNWENGKREPELDKVVELATELNTTIDYLLGNIDVNLLDLNIEDIKKMSSDKSNELVGELVKNISQILLIGQERFNMTDEEIKRAWTKILKESLNIPEDKN